MGISLLASTTSLAEAGTATHFPLSESSDRKGLLTSTIQSRRGHQFCGDSKEALRLRPTELDCAAFVSLMICRVRIEAIGSNYFSLVGISLLASTKSLAEAGTATTLLRNKHSFCSNIVPTFRKITSLHMFNPQNHTKQGTILKKIKPRPYK